MELAGHQLPSGSVRLEPYQNWLLHDAFYAQPRSEPHPVAAFVLANRGVGISLKDLFALFGSDINDGPLLAESAIELHRPLAEDADYEVRGTIESVESRRSRRIGPFDRITCRFDLFEAGHLAATVTNVFAIPREPKGRGDAWTEERGTSDEGRHRLESAPAASGIAGQLDRVDPARMKVLALLLADPNPIHLDAAAAQRLGVADRPVNQGPSTMALAANMVLAAFPGARLTSLRTRLLGLVLAEDRIEGGGDVTGREIVDGQERVRCQVYLEVPGRGRVLEGEAVLVLPAADGNT
jgi:acyl dehydratase